LTEAARNLLFDFIVVSAAYLFAFVLSIYLILPFQTAYTPELAAYASLFFLPHGVRVLSAWLFGLKAIPLIAPAALLTHWLNFGADGFSISGILGVFSGVVCAVITFWGLAKLGMDFRLSADKRANWRDVVLAGSIASVINTFGMGWAFSHNTKTLAGYLVGDITGMFACMLSLMFAFKIVRELRGTAV
jgi:hypothetical protein